MHPSPMIDRVIRRVSLHTPNLFAANVLLLGMNFIVKNRRLPVRTTSARATLSDYIFWKSVGSWTDFERACVDKDLSKQIARQLCPDVGIVRTLDVFALEGLSFADFKERLTKFQGQHAVAKPTHGSGSVLFLAEDLSERKLRKFYKDCQASYFPLFREGQYDKLEKKVLIERSLGNPSIGRKSANDIKFFCSRGKAFMCQIVTDRFEDIRLVNLAVPDFIDSGVSYGTVRPDQPLRRPERWQRFIELAEKLSVPFEFVRIDLYDGDDDIYFGEFTFTPGAGLTPFSDPGFDQWLLRQLRCKKPVLPQPSLKWAR